MIKKRFFTCIVPGLRCQDLLSACYFAIIFVQFAAQGASRIEPTLTGKIIFDDSIVNENRELHLKCAEFSSDFSEIKSIQTLSKIKGKAGNYSFEKNLKAKGINGDSKLGYYIEIQLLPGDQIKRNWSLVERISGESKLPFPINRTPFFRFDHENAFIWLNDQGDSVQVTGEESDSLREFTLYSPPTPQIETGSNKRIWLSSTPVISDPMESENNNDKADWKGAYISHTKDFIHLKLDSWRDLSPSHGINTFIDTDLFTERSVHGLKYYSSSDFLIQEKLCYQYTGYGIAWQWDPVDSITAVYNKSSLEFSISRRRLKSPDVIRVLFMGDNKAFGVESSGLVDWMPQSHENPKNPGFGLVHILNHKALNLSTDPITSETKNTKPAKDISKATKKTIVIDGSKEDWKDVPILANDPNDISANDLEIDWRKFWATHDDFYFYLAFENDSKLVLDKNAWAYSIFVDTDKDKKSGFRGPQNNYPLGADFVIQGKFLHRYSGSGSDWEWAFVRSLDHGIKDNFIELKIPKQFFSDFTNELRFFLVGQNSAFGEGRDIDYVPDDKYAPIILNTSD